jgi:hypothetical protein
MPTDDIAATVTPPVDEHESPLAGRSTCPPEELRIHPSRIVDIAPSSHNAIEDHAPTDVRAQQPTPPPTDDPSSPARTPSPSDSHSKPTDASVEVPTRDIPTPMSAPDDGADDQRVAHPSPLSATASLSTSWPQQRHAAVAPYIGPRVCTVISLQRLARVVSMS